MSTLFQDLRNKILAQLPLLRRKIERKESRLYSYLSASRHEQAAAIAFHHYNHTSTTAAANAGLDTLKLVTRPPPLVPTGADRQEYAYRLLIAAMLYCRILRRNDMAQLIHGFLGGVCVPPLWEPLLYHVQVLSRLPVDELEYDGTIEDVKCLAVKCIAAAAEALRSFDPFMLNLWILNPQRSGDITGVLDPSVASCKKEGGVQ